MRFVPRQTVVLTIRALLAMLAAAGALRGADAEWRYTRSEHFEVLSAAPEQRTRELVVELEQFRASFIATFALRPAAEPRVTMVLFDSDKRFTPYKPTYRGRPKLTAGYFLADEEEAMVAMNAGSDLSEEDNATETILHEYVHLLVHSRGLRLPTWLDEGLAELFSTFAYEGATVEFGRPKQSHVDLLNRSALLPLTQLIAVRRDSPDYNEENRVGMFYAQSWALTHFLVCGTDQNNAARLGRFLATADRAPAGPEAAFREIFAEDYKTLDFKLRAYLQGGSFYQRRVPALLKGLAERVVFRRATELERELALLQLRWRVQRAGDSMLVAVQLAEKFPEAPGPHEVLAEVRRADGEMDRALEHWRRAAELNSENPSVLLRAARARLGELGLTPDPDQRWPATLIAQVRQWLDRAAQRNPGSEQVVELLALTEANAAEFRVPVINEIQRRVAQLKDPNPTLLALAVARWKAKDAETARSITAAVVAAKDARVDTRALARALHARFADKIGTERAPTSPIGPAKDGTDAKGAAGGVGSASRAPVTSKRPAALPGRAPVIVTKLAPEPARVLTLEECLQADRNYARATEGDAGARYAVAVAQALGRGSIFDPEEAWHWLKQAAESGHAGAAELRPRAADDAEAAVRLLREREGGADGKNEFPPVGDELSVKIKAAAQRGADAPPEAVYRARARYPDAQRKARIAGTGTVRLTIDERGRPQGAQVWGFSLPPFGKAAEASVRGWRFVPAIKDGKPVSTVVDLMLTFGEEASR